GRQRPRPGKGAERGLTRPGFVGGAELRERVTGVEPATLCLASAATPVTSPSEPIAREYLRGFPCLVVSQGWALMGRNPVQRRYNARSPGAMRQPPSASSLQH